MAEMSEQEIFNGLIATYRDLNTKVRPLPEARLKLGHSGDTVRDVILTMRDEELHFSQALKDRITGAAIDDVFGGRRKTTGLDIPSPDDTTVEVISQFGTARESTLAMLRGLAPEAWDDKDDAAVSIRDAAADLVSSDGKHLEKIVRLLGSPSPN
jgi:hypothetical protein